ncbi:MAG: PKD domain-containing protein [Solirubrobacteraceae bacterium]
MLQRRLPAVICAAVASFVLAQGTALAHPGALDLTFGHGTGEVTAQLGTFFGGASAVAQTSDGGLIIAGFVPTSNTAPIRSDLGVLALDASGNPRAGFGTGGHVTIPLPGTVSASVSRTQIAVAQRSDGSYLVGAVGLTGASFNTPNQVIVDTVSASGVAGTASEVTIPVAFASAVGVAADGAHGLIYFDGQNGPSPSHTVDVARVTAAGALDAGFGTAGVASQAVDAGNTATVGPIAVQSDGKPVVAVSGTKADNTTHEASLARFTTGGQPDPGFGTDGVATLPAGTPPPAVTGALRIAFSAAGIAVLWGRSSSSMVIRFTSAGQLVNSFGGSGAVAVGNGGLAFPSDLALGDDGTVIVIGQDVVNTADSPTGVRSSAYANRLLANGSHDLSFGDNPINGYGPFASWWNGATDLYGHFASVLTDHGLVTVGSLQVAATPPGATSSSFAAARIITAANRPPTTSLAVSPGSAVNTATFRFTASAHDPDIGGSVVSYQWDFNGDGVVDRITTSPTTSYTYASAGHFTAHVHAFDNEGASSDASTRVTVTSAAAAAARALRAVSTKLSIGKPHRGKRSVTISFGKLASTAGPCQYFALLKRGRTLLGTAQGTVDRRHTKISFTTRAGRGAKLSVTVRLIDKFANRIDKSASAKIKH